MPRTTLTGTQLVERQWKCPQCGARGMVVRRVRRSRWRRARSALAAPAEAEPVEPARPSDAQWDLKDEATRMLTMIRCPACLAYAPRALLRSGLRLAAAALGATILAAVGCGALFVAGDFASAGLLLWLGGACTLGAVREVQRWRAASRASVLRLQPGPAEYQLPKAVVHKLAAPPGIVPIESAAPEPVAPADDASGPRFLLEK